ncbi:MAG TPA: hypothetical protein VK718_07235 [Ferruginibacter sp.]|jgi:hypothetical protein|nr:hypothetical protein [Ferruginibacter sp.]
MQKAILVLVLSVFLFSCKKGIIIIHKPGKTTNAPGGDDTNPYLSSIRIDYGNGKVATDSFSYDANHDLVKFIQYTTVNGATPLYNTNDTITFSFAANGQGPVSYRSSMFDVTHQLLYDANSRIIKDSVSNVATSNYNVIATSSYSYPNNSIVYTALGVVAWTNSYPGTPIYQPVVIDTITIADQNIDGLKENNVPTTASGSSSFSQFGYPATSYTNPAYHAAISSTIGPLLFNLISTQQTAFKTSGLSNFYVDFISKDLPNSIVTNGNQPTVDNDTYTLDAQGRVGTGIIEENGATPATLTYSYY